MGTDCFELPAKLAASFRKRLLVHMKGSSNIDDDELSLFEWYVKETETIYSQMYADEFRYIQEQNPDSPDYNDSGMIPVQYFIKRSRYAHVIYLASLGETYLVHACSRLAATLGKGIVFNLNEINGKKWERERKFLERYGMFDIPGHIWDPLTKIYLVRNALVHENGAIHVITEEEREEYRKKYKDAPGVNVDGIELEVQPEFVVFGFSALRAFMVYVNKKIAGVIDRAIQLRSVN